MLRVLHVTNAYPYTDVPEYGIFVKEQIESINNAGVGVQGDILFVNGRKDGKKAYVEGIRELRSRAPLYDVIHCHHLYSGFVTAVAMVRKPTVLSFLNDWLHEMEGVNSPLVRKAGCNFGVWWADRVIFKSPIPEQFRGNPKVLHIPNGANASQFRIVERAVARAALGLDPDTIYPLFVSSKDLNRPQKRYDRYKAVLGALRQALPNRRIEELLLVNQPRERVLDYFNAADLHLMTSDFEGSPNSVKEAVCCGTPVVTTNVGNVTEMVSGLPNCYVSSSFEIEELCDLALRSLANPPARHAIREGFIAKGFSQQATTTKLTEIYRSLSGEA